MGIPRIVETALSGIHREGITTYNSPFFQLCVTLPIVIPCACAKREQSDWLCPSKMYVQNTMHNLFCKGKVL